MPVHSPHRQYAALISRWERARDCYEGSDAVKAAGDRYLPRLDSHKMNLSGPVGGEAKYNEYRLRALFFNAMGRTVEGMAGALYQVAPTLTIPTSVGPDLEDVTLSGESLEMFGLRAVQETLITGRFGILVDFPQEGEEATPRSPGSTPSRPYWIGYRAEDILSWRTTRIEGRELTTMIVLREFVEEEDPKDPFLLDNVEQYRVLELVRGEYIQTVWSRVGNSERWVPSAPILPSRRGDSLPFIPFIFIGPTSTAASVQKPPLDDLVVVNLSHYRTSADLEHGRHFTALPQPWVSGVIARKGQPLHIGSSMAWELEKDGKAGMLEYGGQGLGALERAEKEKREMMAVLGARLLEDQPRVAETASGVAMRHSGEQASLRTIAQTAERALTNALRIHSWWVGTERALEDLRDIAFELNKDFFSTKMQPDDLRSQIMALQAETISYKTFYANLTKGGLARPGVTVEEEEEEIALRRDSLAPAALPGNPPEEGDEGEPGDEPVSEGDWWKIVRRQNRFILIEKGIGQIGDFATKREADAEVERYDQEEGGEGGGEA